MVFPGWWTNLNFGKKISVKVYKHRNLVRNKSVVNKIIDEIECINFFTYWDMMVFPGWWTNLNFGKKISVKVYKHRHLVRNKSVIDKIIEEIIV